MSNKNINQLSFTNTNPDLNDLFEVWSNIRSRNEKITLTTISQAVTSSIANNTYIEAVGTDTYIGTSIGGITSFVLGDYFLVRFENDNTGISSLNIDGTGDISISKAATSGLDAGDISAGVIYLLIYDGTNFQLDPQVGVEIADEITTGLSQEADNTEIENGDQTNIDGITLFVSPAKLVYFLQNFLGDYLDKATTEVRGVVEEATEIELTNGIPDYALSSDDSSTNDARLFVVPSLLNKYFDWKQWPITGDGTPTNARVLFQYNNIVGDQSSSGTFNVINPGTFNFDLQDAIDGTVAIAITQGQTNPPNFVGANILFAQGTKYDPTKNNFFIFQYFAGNVIVTVQPLDSTICVVDVCDTPTDPGTDPSVTPPDVNVNVNVDNCCDEEGGSRYSEVILGDDVTTVFEITHNLNEVALSAVTAWEIITPDAEYTQVNVGVDILDVNRINIIFAVAPEIGEDYNIVIRT